MQSRSLLRLFVDCNRQRVPALDATTYQTVRLYRLFSINDGRSHPLRYMSIAAVAGRGYDSTSRSLALTLDSAGTDAYGKLYEPKSSDGVCSLAPATVFDNLRTLSRLSGSADLLRRSGPSTGERCSRLRC